MPLDRGYYPAESGKKPPHRTDAAASPTRAMAKARAGKKLAAERKVMKGGPGQEGFTRL